jgi:hypothetical protein
VAADPGGGGGGFFVRDEFAAAAAKVEGGPGSGCAPLAEATVGFIGDGFAAKEFGRPGDAGNGTPLADRRRGDCDGVCRWLLNCICCSCASLCFCSAVADGVCAPVRGGCCDACGIAACEALLVAYRFESRPVLAALLDAL